MTKTSDERTDRRTDESETPTVPGNGASQSQACNARACTCNGSGVATPANADPANTGTASRAPSQALGATLVFWLYGKRDVHVQAESAVCDDQQLRHGNMRWKQCLDASQCQPRQHWRSQPDGSLSTPTFFFGLGPTLKDRLV